MGKSSEMIAGQFELLERRLGGLFNTVFFISFRLAGTWVSTDSSPSKHFMAPSLWLGSPLVVHVTLDFGPESLIYLLGFYRAPSHPWSPIQP